MENIIHGKQIIEKNNNKTFFIIFTFAKSF